MGTNWFLEKGSDQTQVVVYQLLERARHEVDPWCEYGLGEKFVFEILL